MNPVTPLRQFSALFGYHATSNLSVWAWTFPMVLFTQAAFGSGRYDFNLENPSSAAIIVLWIPLFVASYVFGAQIYGNAFLQTKEGRNAVYHSEFLLTRALDRGSVYWARAAIYWSVFLIPVAVWIYLGWKNPSFVLQVPSERLSHYLAMLPGSHVQETVPGGSSLLLAPSGGMWLRLWASFLIVSSAAIFQLLYTILNDSLQRARFYQWIAFAFCLLVIFGLPLFGGAALTETLFLFGVNHWIECLIALLGAVGISLFVSRKRFLDQEF